LKKEKIHTVDAPDAIGPYSQAIKIGDTVYLSGQIPLDPMTMMLVDGDIRAQTEQVLKNMQAVVKAAGGSLSDIVKLTIYLTDLSHFAKVNEVMTRYFVTPYPARTTIQVAALPKAATVEVDAIMIL